jgi:NTP pyrophosphatase (non-canonical NTP hydrolase)
MATLKNLTERIVAFRDQRDWKQFHTPKDMVLSLMMEAAELAEHVQWKNDAEITARLEERKEAAGEELADVLYWTLLIANDFGINLEEAFEKKMKSNEQKYPVEKAKGKHNKYTELV